MAKSILLLILHKTDSRRAAVFCFILYSTFSFSSGAQTMRLPLAAVYSRLHAYSSNYADAFSFQGNQAALAAVKNVSAGVYGERKFMLAELSQYNACVALPTSSGNYGFAASYAGSPLYNESQVGIAYGRRMGKLDAGVQFNYYSLKIAGYGSAGSVNFEAGAIAKVTDRLNTGFHIYNPAGSRLGENGEERLPAIYSAGFGYDLSSRFFLCAQVEKMEDQPVSLNTCMLYCFAGKLFARAGISTGTTSFFFGTGFLWNDLRVDVTAGLHQQLGFSAGLMLIYNAPPK